MDSNEAKPSLAKKLAEVTMALGWIQKDGRNTAQNYSYTQASDVFHAVRGELGARNVALLAKVVGWQVDPPAEGKSMSRSTVDLVYTFVDGDTGEMFECPWVGQGMDSGDKGIWKAMTGGLKNFLVQSFMLPTGDDPEADPKTDKESFTGPAASKPRPRTYKGAKTEDFDPAAYRASVIIKCRDFGMDPANKEMFPALISPILGKTIPEGYLLSTSDWQQIERWIDSKKEVK